MDGLEVEELLGNSRISSVVRCRCCRSGRLLAVKMYNKQAMTISDCRQVAREIEIHSSQDHASIIGLYAAFEDLDGIYLVQEYAPAGDLYKALESAGGYLAEDFVAQQVVRPLMSALAALHAQGVVHRDIKPENILLAEVSGISEDGAIRLADFGLAVDESQELPKARVGTLDYFAPEVVRSATSKEDGVAEDAGGSRTTYKTGIDMWAAGILAYELLLGAPPFEADTKEETYQRIVHASPFLPMHWSQHAKAFLSEILREHALKFQARVGNDCPVGLHNGQRTVPRMTVFLMDEWMALTQVLQKDPALRPTAEKLLQHPWLLEQLAGSETKPPSTPQR